MHSSPSPMSPAKDPAGQATHRPLAVLVSPPGQAVQSPVSGTKPHPDPQSHGTVRPTSKELLKGWQGWHASAPSTVPKVPAGHRAQADQPMSDAKVPAVQGLQIALFTSG